MMECWEKFKIWLKPKYNHYIMLHFVMIVLSFPVIIFASVAYHHDVTWNKYVRAILKEKNPDDMKWNWRDFYHGRMLEAGFITFKCATLALMIAHFVIAELILTSYKITPSMRYLYFYSVVACLAPVLNATFEFQSIFNIDRSYELHKYRLPNYQYCVFGAKKPKGWVDEIGICHRYVEKYLAAVLEAIIGSLGFAAIVCLVRNPEDIKKWRAKHPKKPKGWKKKKRAEDKLDNLSAKNELQSDAESDIEGTSTRASEIVTSEGTSESGDTPDSEGTFSSDSSGGSSIEGTKKKKKKKHRKKGHKKVTKKS